MVTGVLEVALEVGKEIAAARRELIKSILTAALIGLLVAVIMVFFASQKISSPIKALTAVVQKMAQGDLKVRMGDIRTKDEIAILGNGFNDMAANLEKSYRELQEYSENLEEMVAARTAELAAANARITAMLDNMKLSVFSVDAERKIDGPVSAFSSEVFGTEILSKDVLDIVFKDVDKTHESYGKLNSALITVFGEDEFQWDIMNDGLPREITLENPEDDTIQYLEIKYSPLWNDQELLDQILFVVDDVTELKRLEKEAAKMREESDKQNKILTQLSNVRMETLESNFYDFKFMVSKVQSNISNAVVSDTFILLHTIKGNARVLGLDMIATKVHEIEVELYHLKGTTDSLDQDTKKRFSKLMDELLVVISAYNDTANRIFKIKVYFSYPDPEKFIDLVLRYLGGDSELKDDVRVSLEEAGYEMPETDDEIVELSYRDPQTSKFYGITTFSDEFLDTVLENNRLIVEDGDIKYITNNLSGTSKNYYAHILKLAPFKEEFEKNLKEDLRSIELLLQHFLIYNKRDLTRFKFNFPISKPDSNLLDKIEKCTEYSIDFKMSYVKDANFLRIQELNDNMKGLFPTSNVLVENNHYLSHFYMFLTSLAVQAKESLLFMSDPKTYLINDDLLSQLSHKQDFKINDLFDLKRFPLTYFAKRYAPVISEISKSKDNRVRVIVNRESDALSESEFQFVDKYLSQLLVNSVEHGIESIGVRRENKKSEIGTIEIKAIRKNDKLSIVYSDDGTGLDYEKIKTKITDKDGTSMDNQAIFKYLLENTLSTADTKGLYSGMGEGLSILGKDFVDKKINVKLIEESQGFHLQIDQS